MLYTEEQTDQAESFNTPRSGVNQHLEAVEIKAKQLHEIAGALEARLAPVLLPEKDSVGNDSLNAVRVQTSPLADRLMGIHGSLGEVEEKLTVLCGRLEL